MLECMTLKQVAAYFRVSGRTIYRWVAIGEFPAPIKLLGRPRWLKEDIEKYVQKAREAARSI